MQSGGEKLYIRLMAEKEIYRFDPICDREGKPSRYHKLFVDDEDFTINPTLLKQINFDNCRETTPEGRALWLYIRLCQILLFYKLILSFYF